IPSNVPWARKSPEGLPATTVANLEQMHVTFPPGTNPAEVVAVHPTQLYETALLLLVVWWLWRRRDHRHGTGWLFGMYLGLGGAQQLRVAFVRPQARAELPRLPGTRHPHPIQNGGHVVEHRARHREERLEERLRAESVDRHEHADECDRRHDEPGQHRRRARAGGRGEQRLVEQ